MSNLRTLFLSFVGDAESAVAMVADGIRSAVITAGQHGTQAPLIDALTLAADIRGRALYVTALREGLKACALAVTANGKGVTAPGLKVGKMTADAAQACADEIADAFTLAAGTILTAKIPAKKASPAEIAEKACAALVGLTAAQVRKALTVGKGADLRAMIVTLLAEEEQARAAQATADAIGAAQATPATADATADATPATV